MSRTALLLLLLLGAGTAQAEGFWASLWQNADQRGERLLQQGDAAAAARTYADPRRRAYAELLAGDYPAAARDFAAFDDGDAHYNRGNALARAGDLAAALQAYDSALARDQNNRDARHNRDLVAKALQQHPPPPKQGGGQGQSGKQDGKQGKSANRNQSAGQGQTKVEHGGKPGQERDKGGQGQANPQGDARSGRAGQKPPGADSAAEARRAAEAGLGREADRNAGDNNAGDGSGAGKDARLPARADAPRSEQQLAQEQWLRQIPDDPGGLLRRKFMIEHLMRQQGNQP